MYKVEYCGDGRFLRLLSDFICEANFYGYKIIAMTEYHGTYTIIYEV